MTDALMAWPFSRQNPTLITLPVKPGCAPSPKPPVRIFLGTEDAQYRAERIFFFSIEQVRDPARVYEIYLMKNVSGFDRRSWRTGFTNYRYAIPSFAGGHGRAIYNDVDQIYLSDPAALFDIDMAGSAYMAISAKDTSVMVMDCERMLPMWNRDVASRMGKHELISKPATTPGLWGELDGHWNARDQEYVEGRTHCLHYTALHQQPWEPFPDDYSYHPNPLAYIWDELDAEADRQDYELFSATVPSPEFGQIVAAAISEEETPIRPSSSISHLFRDLGVQDALICHAPHATSDALLPAGTVKRSLIVQATTDWPKAAADVVVINGLFTQIPTADLPWVLDALFQAAKKLVYVQLARTTATGMGSVGWWEQRLREAAKRHPTIHWQLDANDAAAALPNTISSVQVKRKSNDEPMIWTMAGSDATKNAVLLDLAKALGGPVVDIAPNADLPASSPHLVLTADVDGGKRALALKAQHEALRLVQLGHTGLPPADFDLVVTTPDERIPIRPNILHIPVMPLPALPAGQSGGPLLVITPTSGYQYDAQLLAAAAKAVGPGLRVWFEVSLNQSVRSEMLALIDAEDVSIESIEALVIGAERVILALDQADLMALAATAGTPIDLVQLVPAYERLPAGRQIMNVAALIMGGGTSYRGTPHQQYFVARSIDKRVINWGWQLPRDVNRLRRALIGLGLARWSDATQIVASPKPLAVRERIIECLQALLQEETRRQSARDA